MLTFRPYLRIYQILILLAPWVSSSLSASDSEAFTDFVKVERTDSGDTLLQTAITSYGKGAITVDLVGAVHIADKAYYEELNQVMEQYPALLFELIGGEAIEAERDLMATELKDLTEDDPAAGNPGFSDENEASPSLIALSAMTYGMQKKMALESQLIHIDYYAPNFIHADLSIEEFEELSQEDGNSLSSFMLKQAFMGTEAKQPSTLGFLIALLSNNPNRLKLQMVDTLAQADKQLASLDDDNLIITQRNAKCFEVLERTLGSGTQRVGIFYGAAHFPHMEKLLLERGYTLKSQKWLNAWTIPAFKQPVKE